MFHEVWELGRFQARVLWLLYSIVCIILRSAVLLQCQLVTDRRTDTRRQHIPR